MGREQGRTSSQADRNRREQDRKRGETIGREGRAEREVERGEALDRDTRLRQALARTALQAHDPQAVQPATQGSQPDSQASAARQGRVAQLAIQASQTRQQQAARAAARVAIRNAAQQQANPSQP